MDQSQVVEIAEVTELKLEELAWVSGGTGAIDLSY
jgi:hypothetical protein